MSEHETALTQEQLVQYISELAIAGGARRLAAELGVAPSLISQVTTGKIPPPPKLLAALGVVKEVRYVIR